YQLLVDMLSWESRTDVRDQVVRAFGYMHATEAIPIVLDASRLEPALRNAPETLVRLGAIDVGIIAGTDVRRGGAGLQGFGACHEEDPYHDWNYREQTWCESTGDTVHLKFNVPPAVAANGPATVLLRLRRTDAEAAVPVTVKLGRTTTDLAVDRQFLDARWSQALAAGPVDVTIRTTTPGARLGVDHLLVYPNANSPQLAPPGASTTPDGTR
ncbi:MAG: hypothetical protein KC417_17170, partial [Myxococcales bacterium]|nr:hypothetical protein [Myxococcales bacterium]